MRERVIKCLLSKPRSLLNVHREQVIRSLFVDNQDRLPSIHGALASIPPSHHLLPPATNIHPALVSSAWQEDSEKSNKITTEKVINDMSCKNDSAIRRPICYSGNSTNFVRCVFCPTSLFKKLSRKSRKSSVALASSHGIEQHAPVCVLFLTLPLHWCGGRRNLTLIYPVFLAIRQLSNVKCIQWMSVRVLIRY